MATNEQREALCKWLEIRREIGYDESERTQKQIDEIVAAVLEDSEVLAWFMGGLIGDCETMRELARIRREVRNEH